MDYLDLFNESIDAFTNVTIAAGSRVDRKLVDLSSRTGYSLIGAKPKTAHALACEYYQLDWETGKRWKVQTMKTPNMCSSRVPGRVFDDNYFLGKLRDICSQYITH